MPSAARRSARASSAGVPLGNTQIALGYFKKLTEILKIAVRFNRTHGGKVVRL